MGENLGDRGRFWHSRHLLTAVFCAVFLLMLFFSALTPLIADDFSYKFSWADVSRIQNPMQIIASMAVHRQVTNGRVLAHGLVQLLLIPPKAVFNVLNALNACLLGFLALRYFQKDGPARSALLLCCGAFLLWNETPVFGQVFLWLDGAVNYSWGVSLFLLFLWPYAAAWLDYRRPAPLWQKLLFLPLAFAAGAYSENGSIATLFAAACLTGLRAWEERRLRLWPLLGLAVGCLGFAFLMSAPVMSTRAAELSVSVLAGNIRKILVGTWDRLGALYCIYAALLAVSLVSHADRKKLLLSLVYVLSGLGSLAAFIFADHFTDRHFCFTVLFLVLACLLLLSALLERGNKVLPAVLTALAATAFAFHFLLGTLDIAVIFGKSLERGQAIREALEQGQRDLVLEIYVPATKYSAAYGLEDLNLSGHGWPNDSLALYYGLDSVTGVEPEA